MTNSSLKQYKSLILSEVFMILIIRLCNSMGNLYSQSIEISIIKQTIQDQTLKKHFDYQIYVITYKFKQSIQYHILKQN